MDDGLNDLIEELDDYGRARKGELAGMVLEAANRLREMRKEIIALEQEPTYYPPCMDCNKKMDEIRRTYDKLKEQEPCEDAISRQAVRDGLASIAKAKAKSDAQKSLMGRVMFFTERLPSVNPQEPCEDAISRQEAIDCLNGKIKMSPDMVETFREYLQGVIDAIEGLASVMPKQRTGHWIKDDITERSKSEYKHKCDRCGAYHRAMYDYCPSCGAKMQEVLHGEQ